MCAASESSASEDARIPAVTSATMNARISDQRGLQRTAIGLAAVHMAESAMRCVCAWVGHQFTDGSGGIRAISA